MENTTLKNWLIPSITFFLFLYVIVLLGIFTYRNSDVQIFQQSSDKGGAATLDDFKKEMSKKISR